MEVFKQITANNITLKEYPFWKELAMEAYLLENEDILKLDQKNFDTVTVLDAEIALKEGRKDGNGRIDLLVKYAGEYLGVVEIKVNGINEDSLHQLEDYLNQKEQILKPGNKYWKEESDPKWVGLLVGTEISDHLREKLSNGYEYNGIPIAGMTIKRYRSSDNEVFVISDTYFKFKYLSKDYSRFAFNGKEYNKGRLVNAVIKYYIEMNPQTTFPELKKKFPDFIQGSFGVFELLSTAQDIALGGYKRYYINPEEQIKLSDETISTCTQWNPNNISAFINQCAKLNLKIELK